MEGVSHNVMCDVDVGPGPHCQERCKDIELNHNKTYPRLPGVTGGHIFSPSSFLQIKSGHKHREPRPLSLTMVSSATWRGYLGYYGQWRYGVWGWMGLTDVWPGCPWQAGPRIRTLSMWPWGGYVMLCYVTQPATALLWCCVGSLIVCFSCCYYCFQARGLARVLPPHHSHLSLGRLVTDWETPHSRSGRTGPVPTLSLSHARRGREGGGEPVDFIQVEQSWVFWLSVLLCLMTLWHLPWYKADDGKAQS